MEKFPEKLRNMPRWVCWQRQPDPKHPDKPRKVPMAADGRGCAKSNNPKTWGTYEQAQATYKARGYDGLGFMLGGGVFGVDIDHCMTDGQPSAFAKEIMSRLPTYTEVSPSGTGLHLLAEGTLPNGNQGRRKGALELYGKGRYFTVTGQHIGSHTALYDGTEAAASIIRDYIEKPSPSNTPLTDNTKLLQKIDDSKQGRQFKALWNGDTSAHNGDASAADIALCNILAFWTGKDAVQMDELFRQSGLMRSKWDERHGRDTYGALTIEKAIAECKDVYTGHKTRPQLAPEGSLFYPYEQAYNSVSGFRCELGKISAEKIIQGGEITYVPLANFAPIIREEITRDDGAEAKKEMRIEAISESGHVFPSAVVPSAKLTSMAWVMDSWGVEANIFHGQNKKDQLRDAMQQASLSGLSKRTVYSHTGWRKIGGKWCYLYHGGAIGAEGLSVELEGNLSAYKMAELKHTKLEAAQASHDFLNMGNLRVTAPLLCTMYLSPLFHFMKEAGCAPAFIPFIAGATGTRKTTISTLALSHFGNFNPKQPSASFADTVNSIRRKAFILKDMPLLVDDYHPSTDRRTKANMCGAAQQLARAWGDLAERGRMQADLTIKNSEPPRGMGIMSGEDVPDTGESGIARFYVVDVREGDVHVNDSLTAMQGKARNGILAEAMRGYIDTLRQEAEELPQIIRASFETYRRNTIRTISTAHGRIQEAAACLLVGMEAMLSYWQSAGIDITGLQKSITSAILENAIEQQGYMSKEKPVDMFFSALRELIATQEAYIANLSEGSHGENLIGYCVNDRLYLLPQVVFRAITSFYNAQGSSFPIGKGQLWKRLHEQGLLEARGKELTIVKNIGGGTQRVLSIPKAALLGDSEQVTM